MRKLGFAFGAKRTRRPLPQALQVSAFVACAVATMATSPAPHYGRDFPQWRIRDGAKTRSIDGDVLARAWVSKSGKSGFGVSLCVFNRASSARTVRISGATITVAQTITAASAPKAVVTARAPAVAPIVVAADTARLMYVPLAFDNEALWNRGDRAGVLRLSIDANGKTRASIWRLDHSQRAYHRAPDTIRARRRGPVNAEGPSAPACFAGTFGKPASR